MNFINNRNNKLAVLFLLLPFMAIGQNMQWVPSSFVNLKKCQDDTNCAKNKVCYVLQYTPVETGVLTSYTTGFFASCKKYKAKLIKNESCMMIDNSRAIDGCDDYEKMLINCSGNTGVQKVFAGQRTILHQVCFEVDNAQQEVVISKDETTNLTVSLDIDNSESKTEYPDFLEYKIKNKEFCQSFKGNLKLASTSATYKESTLNWSPAQEQGGGHYEILWSSDGDQFEHLEVVPEHVTKQGQLQYEFIHKEAQEGRNFYKVNYIIEESSSTSNIASQFFNGKTSSLSIYPNPANSFAKIEVRSNADQVLLEIYSSTEVLLKSAKVNSFDSFLLKTGAFAPGMYTAKVIDGEQILTQKFVVVHN